MDSAMQMLSSLRSLVQVSWVIVACCSAPCVALADPPFSKLFRKTGSVQLQVSELKPEHGPWLIFAASFEGPQAKQKADALAQDLQQDLGLPAFIMNKKFDFTELMYGSGIREDGRRKVMKYRDSKVVESYAVLVGEFDSTENPNLKTTLGNVKTSKPKSLMSPGAEPEKQDVSSVKGFRNLLRSSTKDKTPGPLETAFVTRNPLLPIDFFQAPELEKFVYDLNHDSGYNEHSLLDCKGKYTVRVMTFRGDDQFVSWGQSQRGRNGQEDDKKPSALELAAEQAYLATKALRRAGIEAYQFHDRTQSIVTVGSFETLGAPDSNNQFQYAPDIQKVVAKFGPSSNRRDTTEFGMNFGPAVQPRLLFDIVPQNQIPELTEGTRNEQLENFKKLSIGFDIRPTPMAVPRYHASRIYAGAKLGRK
ncbi:MAG: hypothetical protein ACK57G_15710 [Planctomycetota bacterium]|jgi:hypothetical protein